MVHCGHKTSGLGKEWWRYTVENMTGLRSYVERQNLTMRMQMRRFTRLTNAFSKSLRNLKDALALHFAH
jgi:IS1 family transposase